MGVVNGSSTASKTNECIAVSSSINKCQNFAYSLNVNMNSNEAQLFLTTMVELQKEIAVTRTERKADCG